MTISLNTLMLAIKSLSRDIKWYEEKLRTEELDPEDSDYYGEYVLDLSKALSELAGVYEAERSHHADKDLPTVDELTQTR